MCLLWSTQKNRKDQREKGQENGPRGARLFWTEANNNPPARLITSTVLLLFPSIHAEMSRYKLKTYNGHNLPPSPPHPLPFSSGSLSLRGMNRSGIESRSCTFPKPRPNTRQEIRHPNEFKALLYSFISGISPPPATTNEYKNFVNILLR